MYCITFKGFCLILAGEGYVIRWAYFVLADRIVKDRKSRCRSTVAGRVRCAYFFWQGNDCSVNEKGAAAIMAVELDEEKGPQVGYHYLSLQCRHSLSCHVTQSSWGVLRDVTSQRTSGQEARPFVCISV